MANPQARSRRLSHVALVLSVGAAGLVGTPSAGYPSGPPPGGDRPTVPAVLGYPPVAPPDATVPAPLPRLSGSVALDTDVRVRPDPRGRLSSEASASTAATGSVGLRALVLAVDSDDFGVATWQSTLDRVGAAYDVLHTRTTALTSETLVRPDGSGRYNAILLTNSMLVYLDSSGNLVS